MNLIWAVIMHLAKHNLIAFRECLLSLRLVLFLNCPFLIGHIHRNEGAEEGNREEQIQENQRR